MPLNATKRCCAGTRIDGKPCRCTIVRPSGFCHLHEPDADRAAFAQRGAAASAAKRRDLALTVRERFALRLQGEADALFESFRAARADGDWETASAIVSSVLGLRVWPPLEDERAEWLRKYAERVEKPTRTPREYVL